MSGFDLVLNNATILDGTGRPRFKADLGVRNGIIADLADKGSLSGLSQIDCNGLMVAPGFIDTHSHSDLRVLTEPGLPMKVRQGITLEVFGQDGISVAPIRAADRPGAEQQLAGLLGRLGRDWDWESVAEYLAAVDRARPALDCAYLVPHGAVRLSILGIEDRKATAVEIRRMQQLIRESIGQGALGLSTGLIYPPCCFADTAELVELCKTVAEMGGIFVAHMRSESDYLEDAVSEMIEIGKQSGVRVHISHFKVAGRENWPRVDQVLEMVHSAQADGIRLTADQYPYIAGSTVLGAILPPWAHSGGVEATLERLQNADQRGRMRDAMLDTSRSEWDNFWKWSGPDGIVISDVPSGRHPEYVGKTLSEAARLLRATHCLDDAQVAEFVFDLLAEERMGIGMISFSQSEEVIKRILCEPYVNVCTDGLLGGKPHPRAYGTYPRILGRYVRESQLLTLEEAVRKMSGLAAETFGARGYGFIAEGTRANMVIFDAEKITDLATFEDPVQYSAGIHYVVVGGRAVLDGDLQNEPGNGVAVRHKAADS